MHDIAILLIINDASEGYFRAERLILNSLSSDKISIRGDHLSRLFNNARSIFANVIQRDRSAGDRNSSYICQIDRSNAVDFNPLYLAGRKITLRMNQDDSLNYLGLLQFISKNFIHFSSIIDTFSFLSLSFCVCVCVCVCVSLSFCIRNFHTSRNNFIDFA